jgi:hypothetical protein
MNVKPVLGDWEIPRIETIQALENRSFIELDIPGRVGSLYQDMNTRPTSIQIAGSLYGDEARNEFLETLRGKFREGQPVTFVGDIVTATEVQYVVIEALRFTENGFNPDQIDYFIQLKESPPPPPPPDPLGGLDTDLLADAGSFLDSVTGALDLIDSLGSVPDVTNPTPPLTSALDGLTSATSDLDSSLEPLRTIFGTSDE